MTKVILWECECGHITYKTKEDGSPNPANCNPSSDPDHRCYFELKEIFDHKSLKKLPDAFDRNYIKFSRDESIFGIDLIRDEIILAYNHCDTEPKNSLEYLENAIHQIRSSKNI